GYKHEFANSLLGSYYDMDTVYIGWQQLIWRFITGLRLSYSNIRFQGIQPSASITTTAGVITSHRTDNAISFDARVEYPIKRWLITTVGYLLQWNSSDSALRENFLFPLDYTKHEVYLRLA